MKEPIIEQPEQQGTALATVDTSVLAVSERAAIDAQVSTARAYPRNITRSLQEARTLATLDEETAGEMIYALPQGGKLIEGPSVRLAEVMVAAYGNMRVESRIVNVGATTVTAEGVAIDLEKNIAYRETVERRIVDKYGKRYKEDVIVKTCNAARAIASRNATFKAIPRTLVRQVEQAARKASLGKGGTITQMRQNAIAWFGKLGVTDEQLFEKLEVKGLDDVGEEQLITLRALKNAIQDGSTTVEEVFRKPDAASDGASKLNDAVKAPPKDEPKKEPAKKAKAKEPAPPAAAEDDEDARLLESFLRRVPEPAEDEPANVYCDVLDEYLEGCGDGMSPDAYKVAETYIDALKAKANGKEFDGDKAALARAEALIAAA